MNTNTANVSSGPTARPVPDAIREAACREVARAPEPTMAQLDRIAALFAPAVRAVIARRPAAADGR